jgi:hypothetical protein
VIYGDTVKEVHLMKPARMRGSDGRASEGPAEHVTVAQAAELLHLSEISIRRYLTKKLLVRYKVGARTLLRRDEVVGMIKRQA